MLSIVIPLYNKAATVERAVNSVLTQTVQDFELIIVNNGSTDGGEEIVRRMTDPRIRLVEQDNQGVSMARNRGIEEAKGEWVSFLDADDEWEPDFLAAVCSLRDRYPDCNVCATAYYRLSPQGQRSDIVLRNIPDTSDFAMNNYFEVAATSDPPFCSISIMVRREAIQAIGCFPKGIAQGEDLLTWARLAANNKIAYCRQPLSIFHTIDNYTSGKPRRTPPADDLVGQGLEQLYNEHPNIKGLSDYISFWHKMRASMFLRLPKSASLCRQEIALSLKWNPNNSKLITYKRLLLLPYPIRMLLLRIHNKL
jgi:glycosyltransferase involved in cell wall biosynthesis